MVHIYSVYITDECNVRSFDYEVDDECSLVITEKLNDVKAMALEGYEKSLRNHKNPIWLFTDKELATCFLASCKLSLSGWITEYEMARFRNCLNKLELLFAQEDTMKNVDELKLCPFCKGKADVKVDPWMSSCGDDAPKYFVMCRKCGSRTARYPKDKAIQYWNIRKAS